MADITVTAGSVSTSRVEQCQLAPKTAAVALTWGQSVYYDTNGKANLAIANGTAPANQPDGICMNDVAAGGAARILEEGWANGFDLSGLSYGADVYLSAVTAGALATAAPANGLGSTIKVGRVDCANTAGGTFEKILRVNRHPGLNSGRDVKTVGIALSGAAIHGVVLAWQNPEQATILIQRAIVMSTTIATAAGTLKVGTTPTSATTASANLIDTLDLNAAVGTFDNITDKGTLGKSRQSLASGKWVTFSEASGDLTGLVGILYIEYILA